MCNFNFCLSGLTRALGQRGCLSSCTARKRPALVHPSLTDATGLTFIISLANSLIVAWISGILTRFCIAFMTSVLFCNEPATLRTAVKERHRKASLIHAPLKAEKLYPPYVDRHSYAFRQFSSKKKQASCCFILVYFPGKAQPLPTSEKISFWQRSRSFVMNLERPRLPAVRFQPACTQLLQRGPCGAPTCALRSQSSR